MEKKLILVTSPPACGKTYVAKALAKNLKHVVYLDKDTLIGSRMTAAARFSSRTSAIMSMTAFWPWPWRHWTTTILS